MLLTATPAETHGPGPQLRTVIDELIQGKRTGGRAKKYLDSLRVILNQFAKSVGDVPIGAIGDAQVQTYLDTKAIESRTTLRARISTLFRYAVRRHYIPLNPCESLESVKLAPRAIAILTPEQTKKAIGWLRKNWPAALPWFVLTTFCGLRPEEAEATTPAQISFTEGWVKVEAQTSKVRDRRTVYPKPEAMKLLKKSMASGGILPITSITRRRMIRELRDVLGFEKEWPKDVTRHSAASYWLDISERDLAREMGTSERMLRAHYICPVTREQAEAFWKIR